MAITNKDTAAGTRNVGGQYQVTGSNNKYDTTQWNELFDGQSKSGNDIPTNATYIINGEPYTFNAKGAGDNEDIATWIKFMVQEGRAPSEAEMLAIIGNGKSKLSDRQLKSLETAKELLANKNLSLDDLKLNLYSQGKEIYNEDGTVDTSSSYYNMYHNDAGELDLTKAQSGVSAEEAAYNSYWRDLYDLNDSSSLGSQAYEQLYNAELAAGQDTIDLANAQAQQLGLQQAAQVKSITDQLRSERMSQLRAGMSESQIASQNMQSLMANTNALNDQIVASNLAALQGQQQMQNAESTAYQNWLTQMNNTSSAASAMAAADAGDATMQTLKNMYNKGMSKNPNNYKKENNTVTGNTTKGNN